MRTAIVFIAAALAATALPSQTNLPADPASREWKAQWVTHPTAPLREPLVLHFRRFLSLERVPATYPVRVSADNRFILCVNGVRVGDGPARGDLAHWRYEQFDLAPMLKPGQNLITATVWNWGVYAALAQISDRTAFLLESDATGDDDISTPKGWQVETELGHTALDRKSVDMWTYFASGPGEEIDAARYDWSWNSPDDKNPAWVQVGSPMRDSMFASTARAHSADTTQDNNWWLVPDRLPHMEYRPESAGEVVRLDAIGEEQPGLSKFPDSPATLPPGIHAHILLDRKTLTTAYPILTVSGGKGAKIWITYSEALYDKQMHKGDRDAIEGREAHGLKDEFMPDGGDSRVFQPLWWRTWRYLDLDIQTGDQPLTLDSMTAEFTAYPFQERASFESPDPQLKQIWDISWRTARLDAHETYMDTAYYEQLQYIGDTRIQALISYAVAGDGRLARQALEAFDNSRIPEGITLSRYPSSLNQHIPTFSLLWIGMVHDWWMYQPDTEPVKASLEGTRSVLAWFRQYREPHGLLTKFPWWSFVDWVSKGDIPTYDAQGRSCTISLEYLGALEDASDLEHAVGDPVFAQRERSEAESLRSSLYESCWSEERGLMAETPDKKGFSQQANILAVLYDVIPKDRQQAVMRKILKIEPGTTPDGVLSASYYFRFYLARALDHAGMADDYLASIEPWRQLLALHFSTWPETPGETRSDSHAWSAHPIYDLLTLVAGVEPASPGFRTVRIAPHLGDLKELKASFPHSDGEIMVEYHVKADHPLPGVKGGVSFFATLELPGTLTGTFEFGGRSWPLKPGTNRIEAPEK
ncbi:MAG: alpha-L-rhamnosidase C-terminal domain-containing protein [Terracidiphilus sp.]